MCCRRPLLDLCVWRCVLLHPGLQSEPCATLLLKTPLGFPNKLYSNDSPCCAELIGLHLVCCISVELLGAHLVLNFVFPLFSVVPAGSSRASRCSPCSMPVGLPEPRCEPVFAVHWVLRSCGYPRSLRSQCSQTCSLCSLLSAEPVFPVFPVG